MSTPLKQLPYIYIYSKVNHCKVYINLQRQFSFYRNGFQTNWWRNKKKEKKKEVKYWLSTYKLRAKEYEILRV